jgi:uncharacterized protein
MPRCSARARGDARPDSDTDIMVEIDPEAPVSIYDYVGHIDYVAGLFEDIVSRKPLPSGAGTSNSSKAAGANEY